MIGATCVGSVKFSANLPKNVLKGEELGFFLFGGSCVITLFEKNKITFAEDLINTSSKGIELYAQMGDYMCEKR